MENEIVHLVRLALEGRSDDVVAMTKRMIHRLNKKQPDLAAQLQSLIAHNGGVTRNATPKALPVDADSRLELLKREINPSPAVEPIWSPRIAKELEIVLRERSRETELLHAGVSPTRSLLFVGPPGVGKTLAARWLASRMKRPLLTLDLAAVMSSFLGRTGGNIKNVLNYAMSAPAVLLLDEFDAIAKRRDDDADVGELKRLVTVLLQAIDEWPSHGVLIAATNHPELLDPAAWRRFDRVLEFPKPSDDEICETVLRVLGHDSTIGHKAIKQTSVLMSGLSHSDVVRLVNLARRHAIIYGHSLEQALLEAVTPYVHQAGLDKKIKLANALNVRGVSQRQISELTGLSRDTIRKHSSETK